MILTKETKELEKKPSTAVTLFTTNPAWTGLGLNPEIWGEKSRGLTALSMTRRRGWRIYVHAHDMKAYRGWWQRFSYSSPPPPDTKWISGQLHALALPPREQIWNPLDGGYWGPTADVNAMRNIPLVPTANRTMDLRLSSHSLVTVPAKLIRL